MKIPLAFTKIQKKSIMSKACLPSKQKNMYIRSTSDKRLRLLKTKRKISLNIRNSPIRITNSMRIRWITKHVWNANLKTLTKLEGYPETLKIRKKTRQPHQKGTILCLHLDVNIMLDQNNKTWRVLQQCMTLSYKTTIYVVTFWLVVKCSGW